MTELNKKDLYWAVTTCIPAVRGLLKAFPNQLFLAGGYIRSRIENSQPNDVDLFVGSEDAAKFIASILAGDQHRTWKTENARTVLGYKLPIQIIHRWTFDKPEDAIASFDFTIASAAVWYDGSDWKSICHESFYPDLAAKRLMYLSPDREEEAGGSLLRVLKFYQRGYRIPLDSLAAVIVRLLRGVDSERNPTIWENEQGLQSVLSGLLREVDPLIDPDHIMH